MREPSRQTKEALAHVQAPWDAARTERTLRALPTVRRKKQVRRAVGGGLFAALLLGPALWLGIVRYDAGHDARAAHDTRQLRLADGSSVALLETRTDVAVERVDEHLVALHLREGRARFEVSVRPERVFRVRTAEVTVEVLGTIFDVEQRAGRTRVSVTRGRVAVTWENQRAVLVAGDDRLFPPPASAPEASPDDPAPDELTGPLGASAERPRASAVRAHAGETRAGTALDVARREPAPSAAEVSSSAPARTRRSARTAPKEERSEEQDTSWRDHAEGGDFKSAFPLLPKTDTMATMSVADLMLAADAARLSGHPRAALPFLARVIEVHREDARAPLAAFTLGGVLMHQLGLPREAEAAYARARATTQSVALQQDALARQVEAASRAGDEALASKLAREYLDQYPDGRRVNAVRRFGRL